MKDFFISYTGADRQWAEWIAWHLEDAGYTTIIQAWDFHAGGNFVLQMQRALEKTERTIVVLSSHYLEKIYTQPEWAAVFALDPTGEKGLLIPVRIETCERKGLHRAMVYIDVVDLNKEEAQQRLLQLIEQTVKQKRLKPDNEPKFPGSADRSLEKEPRFPGTLPPVWNVSYHRNPNFTGREKILTELQERFESGSAKQVIHGLGGVGKSQIAAEYIYRNSFNYAVVWWIRAEEGSSLIADYTALAKALHLPEKDAEEQEVIIQAVQRWLNTHNEWLLIFDNTRDAESIVNYLPQSSSGHVLITSRNPYWTTIGTPLNIDVWNRDESITFLKKRTGQNDVENANTLADVLGDLPLALEQSAAFIETTQKRFEEYLILLNSRRKELWEREQQPTDYPRTVATTWAMAFDAVQDITLAKDLLLFCSIAAPDDIPKSLLRKALEYTVSHCSDTVVIDSFELDDAVKTLCSYSLIKSNFDTFSIHRLIQAVTKDRLSNEKTAHFRHIMLKVLSKRFPDEVFNAPSRWPACEQIMPHAEKLAEEVANDGEQGKEMAILLNKMGLYQYSRALFSKAEPLIRRALEIEEKLFGPDHQKVTLPLNNLGITLSARGKHADAELLHQRALEIKEKLFGPDHPETAYSFHNLADSLRMQGKYAKAEKLYRQALDIWEKQLGSDHRVVAWCLNNLGITLSVQGKHADAKALCKRALKIQEKLLGPDHPDIVRTLQSLVFLLKAEGKDANAEALFQRALQICEKAYGKSHPFTINLRDKHTQLQKNTDNIGWLGFLGIDSIKKWLTI